MSKKILGYCLFVVLLSVSWVLPVQAKAPDKTWSDQVVILRVPEEQATLTDAIDAVPDGGVIDIAAGTYLAPDGGFLIRDLQKGFTIRSRAGATVILDGGGSHNVVHFENSTPTQGKPVTFDGIIFANGYMSSTSLAGGVSLFRASATFVNCVFKNNHVEQNGVGGGVLTYQSTAFFFDSTWQGNTAANYGGGLVLADNSKVYIHNSSFSSNRVNLQNHSPTSAGGAIHVGNSTLRVSNTRFEANQAGYTGGAIYAIGTWADPVTTPRSDVIVANSLFINNAASRDPSVSLDVPTEGGAFHAENQTLTRIYNSRFVTNYAMVGGAISMYRTSIEIENSQFLGNRATSVAPWGCGGIITANSNDLPEDGTINRPAISLTIKASFFQGRYGNTGVVAVCGGGVYANGDVTRMYGLNGVSPITDLANNRAKVVIQKTVFYDLDVQGGPDMGHGGGLLVGLADLMVEDSIFMNSDAIGANNSSGGALTILDQSLANVSQSAFVNNSSQKYGGAIFVQGSTLNLSGSLLSKNSISTSYGADIFSGPSDARKLPVNGTVQNNIFSSSMGGYSLFDDDRSSGPINAVTYLNNQFYQPNGASAEVYKSSAPASCFPGACTVAELNSLNITHGGVTTDKGSGNSTLENIPSTGKLLAVPPSSLATAASGETTPTGAYLGYVWSGTAAALDGNSLSSQAGVMAAGAGTHTLLVGNDNFQANVEQAGAPSATLTASGSPAAATLSWELTAGTFLDATIDQGIPPLSAASGSVDVSNPVETTYRLLIITKEGGVVKMLTTGSPLLSAPASITVLAGLNLPINKAYIPIQNSGGGVMSWSATGESPDLFIVDTPDGQAQTNASIVLTLHVSKPGSYTGYVKVNAGTAGSQTVQVNVIVVNELYQLFVPLSIR